MKISIDYSLKRMESSKETGYWEDHVDSYVEEELFEFVLNEVKKSCEDDLAFCNSHPMIPSAWIEDIVWNDLKLSFMIGTFLKTVQYESIQNDEYDSLSDNTENNRMDNQELVYDTLTFDIQDIAKQLFAKSVGLESYPSYGIPWISINSIQVLRDDEKW
jgi:hypothetical protein